MAKVQEVLEPEMIDGKPYFTTGQAAKYLGVSQGWFKRRIVPQYNLQPYQKGVGRSIYYEKEKLDPILNLHPVEPEK